VVVVLIISFARFSQGQEMATSAKQGGGMGYSMARIECLFLPPPGKKQVIPFQVKPLFMHTVIGYTLPLTNYHLLLLLWI